MMRSLWAGVTGLQAHQIAMDVEGHNIANVNTAGFKYGRANFSDLMSQTAKVATAPQGELGGKNPMQIGLGTQVNSVTKIFKQGSVQTTDKNTDLAIQGDGFFVISPDGGKTYKYTRNGDFVRDAKGNFVDNNGYIAQGWLRDEVTGEVDITAPVKNIVIKPGLTTPANPSSVITIKANLNSGNEIGEKRTPIYTLDSKHEWMDVEKDGIKRDKNTHVENDTSVDAFSINGDRTLRLKERAVDMGVLFNRAGESFNLRKGQGIWVSFAEARTKALELGNVDNNGNFITPRGAAENRTMDLNINGIRIESQVGSLSDMLAAINAKERETGVRANIINGNKLQLVNNNKSGTTAMSKNIKIKNGGNDNTGLLRDANISWHDNRSATPGADEENAWRGIEVVTAYQYTYNPNPVNTDHSSHDHIKRQFRTTEDLREALQKDARLWVNYTGEQVDDSSWLDSTVNKNTGVRVEVGEKGEFKIFNPKDGAFNGDDNDVYDLSAGGTENRIKDLWVARQEAAAAEAPLAAAQQNLETEKAKLPALETAVTQAQTTYDQAVEAETGEDEALAALNLAKQNLAAQQTVVENAQTVVDTHQAKVDKFTKMQEAYGLPEGEQLAWTGIQPADLAKNWDTLKDEDKKDFIKTMVDNNTWLAEPHDFKRTGVAHNMFLNVSNLSDPGVDVNENDRFMKTMQGIQGALTPGESTRETQGLYLSAHSSSLDIYDSLGSKHSVKFDFTKVGYTDDGGTEWNLVIQVPEPCEINMNAEDGNKNVITGSVRFNADGSLQGFNPSSLSFTANNGSMPNQNIDLNLGNTNDFDGLTSYDRESSTSGISQDGYSGGDLNGIRVDESGTIIGSFTNGRSFGLAQIAMATFTNNEGLEADGGNVFTQTSNSGEPVIGAATTGGRGKVQASSLEMSNVDLSRSLTQLIVVQRGYQANSKTITTSDQMLNTLLQLKQ